MYRSNANKIEKHKGECPLHGEAEIEKMITVWTLEPLTLQVFFELFFSELSIASSHLKWSIEFKYT